MANEHAAQLFFAGSRFDAVINDLNANPNPDIPPVSSKQLPAVKH